ncbi:hypothetical protein [Paraliomyxa miuraensis]|uniref:hypothetical protein n=1 Tax=Paraliomyxa miuraensis TaxID=376150 RepID=UPI002254BD7B|nr:hypothetical protein [Paraliomyxa miuraensis]MCX4242577.1 hypothetical protein [Paraliomyxa miuraensis]
MNASEWSWLKEHASELGAMPAEEASEALSTALAAIDERLGVEITDHDGAREVVVTAGGDVDAFELVRHMVATAPSLAGWTFVALRPAQGFDFEVDAGGLVFDAKALSFQPLTADEAPTLPAIRLLVPNPGLDDWSELGLRIIERGIGEEAAARIAYLEIGKREDDSENVFAIESLGGWLERHA